MGDRLTEEEEPGQTSPYPYGDMFDEALPQYMAMGMSYDEFWNGEFGTKRACRKAYEIRIEAEQRIADTNNWYMGQYIFSVLQAVPLLVAGLNVKGTSNLPKYPDKPFYETAEEKKREELQKKKDDLRKKKEEDQQKLAMAMFHAMATQFNKHFAEKEKKPKTVKSGQ